jgi:hypothetical protein
MFKFKKNLTKYEQLFRWQSGYCQNLVVCKQDLTLEKEINIFRKHTNGGKATPVGN